MDDSLLTAWQRLSRAVLSTAQVRQVDRLAVERYGMHSLVLMENAALGCVHWLLHKFTEPQSTTILCGSGNNGGDGLAIARHLLNCGWPCRVLVCGPAEKLSDDARANLEILTAGDGLQVEWVTELPNRLPDFSASQLIIDALLGTGAKGDPREPLASLIRVANRASAFRVAIDIPTGVDVESGQTGSPCFQTDATLTFVARKPAMQLEASPHLFGSIQVIPIGVPAQLLRDLLS